MNTTNSLALILIAFGLFFMFGRPAMSEISLLIEEQRKIETAIDDVGSLRERGIELTNLLEGITEEERQMIESFLPDKAGLVRLAADVDGVASKHGISLATVGFSEASVSSASSIAEAPPPPEFSSKTISFNFGASYATLIRFLTDLEKSLRILDIRSISVGGSGDTSNIHDYVISADVYYLDK